MASATGWLSYTSTGGVGNAQSLNNSSEFNASPIGSRNYVGSFVNEGASAFFWSSAEAGTNNAWYLTLYFAFNYLYRTNNPKPHGMLVRFIRD